jgi:hypothetical protein
MATTHPHAAITNAQAAKKGIHFIERLLTCARARCSYVGCTRLRHTGPCDENEATDALQTHRDDRH